MFLTVCKLILSPHPLGRSILDEARDQPIPGSFLKTLGTRLRAKGLLGRMHAEERLAVLSCILSWRENMEFNIKIYHIVIYSCVKPYFLMKS
jgi:hypothetical protein